MSSSEPSTPPPPGPEPKPEPTATPKSESDLEAALARLPHGPEFRFLDRLSSLEGGRRGIGEYRLRGDEPFLRGHFPGMPLLPGVLLVEAGAQLAGVVAQSDPLHGPIHGLKLAAIRQARIHGSLLPGQTVRIEAELLGRMAGLVQARIRATLDNRVLLEADVTLGGSPVAL